MFNELVKHYYSDQCAMGGETLNTKNQHDLRSQGT